MMPQWEKILGGNAVRALSLISACLAIAFASHHFNLVIYMDDMKHFYDVSHTQVELMMALSILGQFCGLPVGYYMKAVGPSKTMLTATVMCTGSCLLLFSSTYYVLFYHNNFWIIIIYQFLLGVACDMTIICSCSISVWNFCHRHTGKVSGLVIGVAGSGALIFAFVYRRYFSGQNELRSLWLMQTIVYLVCNILATFFVRDYSHLVPECDLECAPLKESFDTDSEIGEHLKSQDEGITGLALTRSLNFHLFGWAFLIAGGINNLIRMNAVIILETFKHNDLITPLIGSMPLLSVFFKILFGSLSDRLIHLLPRSFYVTLLIWYEVIIVYSSIGYGDNVFLTVNLIILSYVVDSVSLTNCLAVVSDLFGKKNLGVNIGVLYLGYGLVEIPVLLGFGLFWDRKTKTSECFGSNCFMGTFLMSGTALTAVGILYTAFSYREWQWWKSRRGEHFHLVN